MRRKTIHIPKDRLKAIADELVRQTGDGKTTFEVTEDSARRAVYKALMPQRAYSKCVNPPDSFLTTGVVLFDENGAIQK